MPPDHDHNALTPRQEQVLYLVAQGYPYKQIAQRLIISTTMVKLHMSAIRNLLNVPTTIEAVLIHYFTDATCLNHSTLISTFVD